MTSVADGSAARVGTRRVQPFDGPLTPLARDALRRLANAAVQRDEDRLLPIATPGAMTLAFRRVVVKARLLHQTDCKRAGKVIDFAFLSNFRLHDLRHQAITTWAATGNLSVIELLCISGHKSPRMLTRYTHLSAATVATKLSTTSPLIPNGT